MIKFLQTITTVAGFIIPLATFFEAEGGTGEQKKKQVIIALMEEIDKAGIKFPNWAERFMEPILSLLIDAVVNYLNKTGFFKHGEDFTEGSW